MMFINCQKRLATTCAMLFLLVGVAGCGKKGPTPPPSASRPGTPQASTPSRGSLEDALALRLKWGKEAMQAGAYELASIEYQGVTPILNQMQMNRRQEESNPDKKPRPESLRPYEKAIEAHKSLAERFLKQKEYDLAIAEYQLLTSLLQLAQSRAEQNVSAELQALNWEENREREKVQEWYQKETAAKNLSEERRKAIDKEYDRKLKKIQEKYQSTREKQNAERERIQKVADEQREKFRAERIAIYEKIAAIYKEKGDEQQSKSYAGMVCQERAMMFQQKNDMAKAIEQYKAWLKIDPENYSARTGLAQAYIAAGQWDKAEQQYLWQLKKSPHNQGIMSQLARVYVEQKKWNQAIQQHRAIINETVKQKASLPQGTEHGDEMRKQYDRQIAYQYIELGRVLMQASRKDEAKAAFDKARKLSPEVAPSIPEIP